jgi:hypothetical protein
MLIRILIFFRKVQIVQFILFLSSCVSVKNERENGGLVSLVVKDQISPSTELSISKVLPEQRMWFKDSIVIQEIKQSETSVNSNGVTTRTHSIIHYGFFDLRTGTYYDYSSFSDTAILLRKYLLTDSVPIHGFNFQQVLKTEYVKPLQILSDTVIENIKFKRYKLFMKSYDKRNPEGVVEMIGYGRCNMKGTLFDMGPSLGVEQECPITRLDYLPTDESPMLLSLEIQFIRNKLTSEEQKIFNAWEKYAKNNPVKR